MGESEWQHASWVSELGKWAWIIVLLNGVIGLSLILLFGSWWYPIFVISNIWEITRAIIGIVVALVIIKPKFSNPCGAKDWDALYGWVLKLFGFNVPWMFIWGILFLSGWYSWGAVPVLLPAIMLLFAGPKEYNWTSEK